MSNPRKSKDSSYTFRSCYRLDKEWDYGCYWGLEGLEEPRLEELVIHREGLLEAVDAVEALLDSVGSRLPHELDELQAAAAVHPQQPHPSHFAMPLDLA